MTKIKFYPDIDTCRHCKATTDTICEVCGGCQSTCCRCEDIVPDTEFVFIGRQVHCGDGDKVRRFRCYDINHHINNEDADDIIQEKLGYNDDDYCDTDLLDAVLEAHTNYLKRTMPEVHFEVIGDCDDDELEDLFCDEISEATCWLHEGFRFEELR